ncbi:Protein ASP-7 [Aphelenchoides avenae]|nr:Protein ASP-7 [Aphelenchus avenae]
MHSEHKHVEPSMFSTRFVLWAVGAALALATLNTRREPHDSEAKQAATSVPMKVIDCGSNDECYRVDVSVGTPPQKYRLTLDNTMYDSIHVFFSYMPAPNSTCKSVDISRKHFNPSGSSTYAKTVGWDVESGGQPYYPYEDPKCTKDPFGFTAQGFNDTVQIGSVSVPSVPANLIVAVQAPLNPEWDADGFFGIRPPVSAFEDSYDTMSVFLAAFEKPSITYYYARVDYFDKNSDNGGVLTLGGADVTNCDTKWTTLPAAGAFLGDLLLESFSIEGKSVRSWKYAYVDVTTSYITAPDTAIDAVVKATGAEYDFKTDSYQVDCDKRSSFPDMVFNLPGMDYRLPALDYARRRSASSKRCTLMIVSDDHIVKGLWRLGTSFFRPYCTLLDFKAKTFSLAKALH